LAADEMTCTLIEGYFLLIDYFWFGDDEVAGEGFNSPMDGIGVVVVLHLFCGRRRGGIGLDKLLVQYELRITVISSKETSLENNVVT